MNNIKKLLKKIYKVLLCFILGIVLSITIAGATTYISGSNVGYSNLKLTSTNISDAIDELYTLSRTKTKIKAWEYHETGTKKCINGEEDTCISTTCYKTGSTCDQGTVIKYYVNDNLYHYFYVLRDNGTKITMQQRENTIRNIAWHSGENNNSYGPDTVLPMLEQATSTWTNVDILEYTPGITNLYDKPNVSCTYSTGDYTISCDNNSYTNSTLGTRKSRARIITAKEVTNTGCLFGQTESCPSFMYNYLNDSTSYGGGYDDNTANENNLGNYSYWTMSIVLDYPHSCWYVTYKGYLTYSYVSGLSQGARAVVEITKSNL